MHFFGFSGFRSCSQRAAKAAGLTTLLTMCAAGLAGCEQPRADSPHAQAQSAVPFSHMFLEPTRGRVGYHMHIIVNGNYDDVPTGDWNTCSPTAGAMTYSGELPIGLKKVGGAGVLYGFEGTPRQAGDWRITVNIAYFRCTKGPDLNRYGPRTINAVIHIDP